MSRHENSCGIGKEHPRSHEIQFFCVVFFAVVWGIDSFLLNLTTQLASEIHLVFRLLIFVLLALIAFRLANGSHKLVIEGVDKNHPKVVTKDVYALVRHPMYLTYIVGFIAFIQLTMSFISIIPFVISVILLNMIAAYEENELIKILGQEYIDYKNKVPRWIPNPFKFFRRD
ncbi:MAG: isoprenylcysteine carboxylmethyltransferase family protein [Candidatus Heimdallarchaeota archaeon]|nr:MAG: isoprenylcysteine carboxylmethyltransferase family protein [Candidatus Heimdallarchaeota archaeon]